MKPALPLFLCLALAACVGGGKSDAPPPVAEVTVTSSNFQDSDPTDWPGKSPDRYPVHGIDLSRF